jgi:hypothetical protein
MAKRSDPAGLAETHLGCDYSDEERDFIFAMERYRRVRRRRFPSCREVLAVLKSLGYRRVAEPGVSGQMSEDKGQKAEGRSQRPDDGLRDADPRPAA